MTQLESARKGIITPQMQAVAAFEKVEPEFIREGIAQGNIVIPANIKHTGLTPFGIGKGLSTKVNANIGTSSDFGNIQTELLKVQISIDCHAHALMDLSTGGDIPGIRKAVMAKCPLPVGTVPVYQACVVAANRDGAMVKMTAEDLFDSIESHIQDGVDFITVHCGITRDAIERLKKQKRITDIVSRGGAFLTGWMLFHDLENPLYEQYDRLLALAKEYDVTLSLGDGLRPGCIADATDRAQIQELLTLGELVQRAQEAGVQVMVEGPGHVPLNQIETNIKIQKALCKDAPFYVLGPLVTDVAAGYDHITSAIGGAIAGAAGADFLCYVTPAEHLSLPDPEDVKQGIMASRIAAHAADIVKGVKGAREWDLEMSVARKKLDWEAQARLSIDPDLARRVHAKHASSGKACSMCGGFCAMEVVEKYLGTTVPRC